MCRQKCAPLSISIKKSFLKPDAIRPCFPCERFLFDAGRKDTQSLSLSFLIERSGKKGGSVRGAEMDAAGLLRPVALGAVLGIEGCESVLCLPEDAYQGRVGP